jgi:hypothetical protein
MNRDRRAVPCASPDKPASLPRGAAIPTSALQPAKRAKDRSPWRKPWVRNSSKIPPSPGGAKEHVPHLHEPPDARYL